jgi:hypothetical protein
MEYETSPFTVLQAAMLQLCADALYMETEHESGPVNPCPDYVAYLQDSVEAIQSAASLEDLASVTWVQGKAALALY